MDPPVGTFAGSIVEPIDVPTEDILPPILPPTEDIPPASDNILVRFTVGITSKRSPDERSDIRVLPPFDRCAQVSGAYSNSKIGPPSYPEATKIAQAFVKAAPERLVWGSDWPHPGLPDNNKPNDALLFDLLIEWAPDEATRNRILVQNPEALYGFGKSA